MSNIKRIFVEKKKGFDVEARKLYEDLKQNLGIEGLAGLRLLIRYDVQGISEEQYRQARIVFEDPAVNVAYDEEIYIEPDSKAFAIEYLQGQYDQRADLVAQSIQLLTGGDKPLVRVARLLILEGNISEKDLERIKRYCINPVEAHEASLEKPRMLEMAVEIPEDVESIDGFIDMSPGELKKLMDDMGFAMDLDDLLFCQKYFRDTERRDPTVTEMRMIDTYWSDHCRHTTFLTHLEEIEFEEGMAQDVIAKAYNDYLKSKKYVYGDREKPTTLMDIATVAMKEMRKRGLLEDLDESEEINACSIVVPVDVDGKVEEWLVMFKNETHNHPTEIEPFGGAATCLGGAIRDPLSGRSYVYQAMRITGSGDPRTRVEDTLPGKLPQRKITIGAAEGYSSYGNQVGVATGHVAEIYDEGYVAKRMELGAVIAAAPRKQVVRETPKPGDVVILVGGRTGRDGCGGATGSSKAHTKESLETCGAEVQKGNPAEERKIQRLFRDPAVSTMIKKCNDFGAGGVSVAIGELADGLEINLDLVPVKYEGLDGTELAISESQERMAVVIDKENEQAFIEAARKENLEATRVAVVTEEKRLKMYWRGKAIVDISREFLNSNGAVKKASVLVESPKLEDSYFEKSVESKENTDANLKDSWFRVLQDLNVCSQKGLVEMFDSTIGAGTVLMPFGGKYQLTPAEGMVAKIPVLEGDTNTATIMTHGYNPRIAKWSPFHGAVYAIVEALAKLTAMGGDYRKVRMTFQEYFERLGDDPKKWGKPFSALLGAYRAQMDLGIPSIGGKDSMSGTFEDLTVPPTLVAFAVGVLDVRDVVSPEFKKSGSQVVMVPLSRDTNGLPDFDELKTNYIIIHELIKDKKVLAAHTVREGGVAEAISKMCFGNKIGFVYDSDMPVEGLFTPEYGSIILEIDKDENLDELFKKVNYIKLGNTQEDSSIVIGGEAIDLDEAIEAWTKPLEGVFPTAIQNADNKNDRVECYSYGERYKSKPFIRKPRPRIFIPVLPGTNCEYDMARAFQRAGGEVDAMVFRNLTPKEIRESFELMAERIKECQILVIPNGFRAGDSPEGSGKFVAAVFRNPRLEEVVMELLNKRDGLILGIGDGFQALLKLGLLPYGEIRDIDENAPTLTVNTIGRHISCTVRTRVASTLSPWFSNVEVGDIHTVAISHGEGRFVASAELIDRLSKNGQIASQYVDMEGKPTLEMPYNPNGSYQAIEGITSPDGRILGKMGHPERFEADLAINIPGDKDQKIFEAGVAYFR